MFVLILVWFVCVMLERRYSMPLGISDRDVVQKTYKHYDGSTDTRFILNYQATHQEKLPLKNVIR